MPTLWPGLILLAALVIGAAAGRAQEGLVPNPSPPVTSTEAFAGPYGARLLDEFVVILAASADPACLAARNLAPPGRERAQDWLTRYGQRVIELAEAFDGRSALPAFIASAGAGAPAELDALSRHPQVRDMLALGAAMRQDRAADLIVGALDSHLAAADARLVRGLRAAAAAPEVFALRATRGNDAMVAIAGYLADRTDVPELQRFLELAVDWTLATEDAVDAANAAASRGFDGIVEELRASCIATHAE